MVDGRQHDWEFAQYNLGHYEVLEELGFGGIGEVYVARPTRGEHAGTLVCLKVMSRVFQAAKDSRRQAAIDSLRREARVVSQLRHPNIATLLDSGAYNDVWFLAFELVAGANLGEILELQPEGVGLSPEHVRRIGIEVAAALQCAHEHDVLHRDIKPHNILISTGGEVKIVDFGVAKVNARQAADFTVGVGTPRYWAPEQVREDVVTPQTDIFALGLVLYELLTTVHPFHHDDPVEHRKNVLRGTLPSRHRVAGIPADLAAIVECCLERDPAMRFKSAQAVQAALRSGAKVSGFEYDMGEIAAVAREAVVEVRLLMKDGGEAPLGNNDDTALPEAHLQDTRHATPQTLAETVRDGIPNALTRHVRDEVLADLSQLAQHAYEQRQTQTGRKRKSAAMEGWRHPGVSGVRPSEPTTKSEFQQPRDRHATAMEFSPLAAGAEPALRANAPSENTRAARDPNATNVAPRKRFTQWPLAVAGACAAFAAMYSAFASKPDARPQEGQEKQAPIASTNHPVPSPPSAQQVVQPIAPAAAAVEIDIAPPRSAGAIPLIDDTSSSTHVPGTRAAAQQSTRATLPSTTAEPSPKQVGQSSAPAQPAERTGAKSASSPRRTKPARTEPQELVEVTIGLIPYGEVTVDGKRRGNAPVVVKLAPGPHRVVGRYLQLHRAKTIVVSPEVSRVVLDLRNVESSQ